MLREEEEGGSKRVYGDLRWKTGHERTKERTR